MGTLAMLPLLALLGLPLVLALEPTGNYSSGPIDLEPNGQLWHRVDLDSNTAFLAIKVSDAALINSSSPWLGMGISEPTSGSMLGADIVTGEFNADGECEIVDRHVPFVPFPLTENPGAFPERDDCQDDDSWTLVRCVREGGEMVLEVKRGLDAHDTQDREIGEGKMSFIYSYGPSFGYHDSRRSSVQVTFYGKEPEIDLPEDVDGFFEIRATNFTIPSELNTLYACTSAVAEVEEGRMIVAMEPVLRSSKKDMVHHLTVFLCSGEEYAEEISTTQACYSAIDNGINQPLGNPKAGCSVFVYAYAKGIGRFVMPPEAGFLLRNERAFVVMETHYDNPDNTTGNVDNSGVRLYYTDTKREHEAASLLIADSFVQLFDQTVKNDFKYRFTCPSECTSRFSEPINMVGSFLHMHTTGKEIWTNKFDNQSKFIETVNSVNFWSDSFQKYLPLTPSKILRPGEQLSTTCIYDTTKRPNTIFGLETIDEMCMDFIAYWPRQEDPETGAEINTCAFLQMSDGTGVTACGDSARSGDDNFFLNIPNPKFNDTVGAPTTFGDDLDSCPVVSPDEGDGDDNDNDNDNGNDEDEDDNGNDNGNDEDEDGDDNGNNEDGNDDDDDVCFPAGATVRLRDGRRKQMEDVEIGDEVQVGRDEYSTVFMFTHKLNSIWYRFRQIRTSDTVIVLTRSHFLYVNGELRMAGDVKVGDRVTLENGKDSEVVQVGWEWARGLYNPQTLQGDIVVDGVLASTYTESVTPVTAHGLLAPLRAAWKVWGIDASRIVV